MSTNNFKPHVHILPEDRRNSQIANGFLLETSTQYAAIQVLDEAGGWIVALELFVSDHVPRMRAYPHRLMVILIDFDEDLTRIDYVKGKIPEDLAERVFVLGSKSEPEDLKRALATSYEAIGSGLAKDCRDSTEILWSHELLKHNLGELSRLQESVCPLLFS